MESKEDVEKVLKKYYKAFHEKDWDEFGKYLSDDFTYFTDNLGESDKAKFIDFLSKDSWQGKEYKVYDMKIHISENGDMAFAAYKTSFTGSDKGRKITVNAIETTILIKENDKWKIKHSHTSNK